MDITTPSRREGSVGEVETLLESTIFQEGRETRSTTVMKMVSVPTPRLVRYSPRPYYYGSLSVIKSLDFPSSYLILLLSIVNV